MKGNRTDRINAEIQRAISNIISNDLNNPVFEGQFISVAKVDTSPDLSQTKIFDSILGNADKKSEVFDALRNCAGFGRKQLSSSIELKKTPKVIFLLDETIDNASRINELLNTIKGEN